MMVRADKGKTVVIIKSAQTQQHNLNHVYAKTFSALSKYQSYIYQIIWRRTRSWPHFPLVTAQFMLRMVVQGGEGEDNPKNTANFVYREESVNSQSWCLDSHAERAVNCSAPLAPTNNKLYQVCTKMSPAAPKCCKYRTDSAPAHPKRDCTLLKGHRRLLL